ncbi:MAG: PIN domain nuclease [Nocardioidaceae bacterium]
MILADTSAWVEFDRASESGVDSRMTQLVADEADLAVTEPVVMELLAGARNDGRADSLRDLLGRFRLLRFDAASDFHAAALIYRRCRSAGVTPRGMVDCMIAAVAWRHHATLLTCDADLARVAGVIAIELDPASLSLPTG